MATAYAQAVADWGEAGGWGVEAFWDECTTRATGRRWSDISDEPMGRFSGGEQKRLALEVLLRDDHDVLLLDEPDNFLDVAAKRWLEQELRSSPKTVLLVSHDRELLAAVATKVVTLEANGAWTHGGPFAGYHDARQARIDWIDKEIALHRARSAIACEDHVREMRRRASISDEFATRLRAAESRLRQFDERATAPVRVHEQHIDMRLAGGRTGKKAVTVEGLALAGLTDPFDADIRFGERVAVIGPNGAGKSHFLRLLAGDTTVAHEGSVALGARWCRATSTRSTIALSSPIARCSRCSRAGTSTGARPCRCCAATSCSPTPTSVREPVGRPAGPFPDRAPRAGRGDPAAPRRAHRQPRPRVGRGARDRPRAFQGTVVAVTHDRWFLRTFDRYLLFSDDCRVRDLLDLPPEYR